MFDDLSNHFGEDTVFMDVAGIEPGRDFRRVIDEHVASCGVLLAIIGKSWTDAKDEEGRLRLDDPMDFVRLETASALKRDIPVVPVLVHGARMPRAEQLPDDLKELTFRNGVELTHARWDSDVQVLIKALSPYVATLQKQDGGAPDKALAQARQPTGTADVISARVAPAAKNNVGIIVALAMAAILLAVGGYWAYRNAVETAGQERIAAEQTKAAESDRLAQERAREKAEADRVAADKAKAQEAERLARDRASQQAEAEKIAIEKARLEAERLAIQKARLQADVDRVAREKAEAERLAAEKARAAEAERIARERASPNRGWLAHDFPAPNGGRLVYRIMADGNPACASYDAANCLWGVPFSELDMQRIRVLACGKPHYARWGATGYEDPKHWCSIARRLRLSRAE
ncbi:hypothetical protein [Dechloromonas sp. A34]|uniref:hypothetical protein n=1 Tax=Dechloromonas sp. A34 TaxID=447588 RepID=UPI003A5227F2